MTYYEILKNKPAFDKNLINTIIRKRIELGLTQTDLAIKVGTKQSAISRLECGESNPSLAFLKNLAKTLGCKLNISFVELM